MSASDICSCGQLAAARVCDVHNVSKKKTLTESGSTKLASLALTPSDTGCFQM